MDPPSSFYNNSSTAGTCNAPHRPASSSSQQSNPNLNNAQSYSAPLRAATISSGQQQRVAVAAGASGSASPVAPASYSSSYNSQTGPKNNNAQYSVAEVAAGGRSLHTQSRIYGRSQSSASAPQQQPMHSGRSAVASSADNAVAAAYGVPNPLGMGGVPVAPAAVTGVGVANGISKTDLLRSMYQSGQRQQQQLQSQQQPVQQPLQQRQQQAVVQGPVMPSQYRSPVIQSQHQPKTQQGIQQQIQQQQQRTNTGYAGVQNTQQQSTGYGSQQGAMAAQPRQVVQQNYHHRQQQQQQQHHHHHHHQQQQQSMVSRQQSRQISSQQMQQHAQQPQQQPQQVNQQVYQNVQQYTRQQQQQVQPLQQGVRLAQPSQPQQALQSSSTQGNSSHKQQQSSSSSSSTHTSQKTHRFHLTPEAKITLREAVLSAIRHPNGEVDPECLQRAMAQGLPKQAILNAAVVARQRDRRNREERRAAQHQQRQSQQQQGVSRQSSQQAVPQHQIQHQGMQQQQQPGAAVHHPSMPRSAALTYPPPPNAASSAKIQMQQMLSNTQPATQYSQATAAQQQQQYGQTAHQPQESRIYKQQQQQAQNLQQQQQVQMSQYQSQIQAQKVSISKQRKITEDARKKQQQLQYQKENQRSVTIAPKKVVSAKQQQLRHQEVAAEQEKQRKILEQKQRKEAEVKAIDALKKKNAALVSKIKLWRRTGFAILVKTCAKGVPEPAVSATTVKQQGGSMLSKSVLLKQSAWGGMSMCSNAQSALEGALKQRAMGDRSGKGETSTKNIKAPDHVQKAVDLIRKRLTATATVPSILNENRHKCLTTISIKLLPQPYQLKRHKLQPKRESKFLDKHIRRTRQMMTDTHSKRHKELLKAIVSHQSEFFKYHRSKRAETAKLARLIRDHHRKSAAAKEKEADHAEKARLAALRSNNMAAYTSLLEDTKNERLKFLLDKTDECMNQITTLLASRVAEEEEDIRVMGGEGMMKATFTENVTGGSYYETAHVKSEQVRQPSILIGGELKEYQMSGLQWLVSLYNNRLNGILADEMGLGKTIQAIALIAYLIEVKQNLGPFLVIVPLSTLSNWVNEFAKWLPAASVICYKGTPQQRKQIFRDEVSDGHFNVLLTTYEFVIRDKGSLKKMAWQYAIVDEGHRMKNNQSKFAVTLGTQYNTRRRVLLTGTPLQNNLPELWALLNFLLPAIFNSADTFDQWFNKPFASFGKSASPEDGDSSNELLSNEERMLIIHRLHELLRPFMLRRVKSEVLDQLPSKVEKVIRCELSSWQKELYKQISNKVAGEAATKNFNRGLNNVVMQLRKVCNHPYLFSKDGYHINEDIIRTSGKVELLDRMLPKLKAAGHRVLMFTQMTKMMPILEDYFAYRGFLSLRLDGSTTADDREKRMYMFNAPDSPYFIFLLSTRAGGLGLNLATADTVIIFDSDWNPMMDLQAQDRAHRIGQRNNVRVFRIISQTPVEEKILSRATEKLQMNELVVEAGKFDKSGQGKNDNSLERLKMMELLLTDFDQNQSMQGTAASEEGFEKYTDDGEDDDDNHLNEMISSNDADYQLYCKLDRERTDTLTLYNDVKSCPDWIRYPRGKPEAEDKLVDDEETEILGKRRAAAGEKMYDDGMTEKQFCRIMDRQADQEEKGKKRKKKRSRDAADSSQLEDGDGRKCLKSQRLEVNETLSRSKKDAASFVSATDGNGEVSAAIYDRLISVTRSIIYFKEKGTKRKLSEIFLEKPCPQTYCDYYQLIDRPIGMNDILRKCRAKLYSSVNEFRDDWSTLFQNALTYNGEGSWIVLDAEVLEGELNRLMDKNALSANSAASKKPLRIKLSLKKGNPENGTKNHT